MKKVLVVLLLVFVIMPVFSSWDYGQQELKDDFGDVVRISDYVVNGHWDDLYTDKFILFYFGDDGFHNGYIRFNEKVKKSEESYTSTIKIKEQNGSVVVCEAFGHTLSNGVVSLCTVSVDSETVNKIIPVLSRNTSVKVAVSYGTRPVNYVYGEVDCSDFITNSTCIREGHTFDSGTIISAPSCTEEGAKNYICTRCKHIKTEAIKPTGHYYDAGVVIKSPTCTESGIKTCTCTVCGEKKKEVISPLGHEIKDGRCIRCNNCIVGEKGPAGGLIFYDCDADNENGNADGLISSECGWRYLEAAPTDLSGTYPFGYYRESPETVNCYVNGTVTYSEANCTQTGIGTGKKNTELLVKAMADCAYTNPSGRETTASYAAKVCADYELNGFSDWFLPSYDELNLLYINIAKKGIGTFTGETYWSSSEYDSNIGYVWYQGFGYGYQGNSQDNRYVRPCRAFLR